MNWADVDEKERVNKFKCNVSKDAKLGAEMKRAAYKPHVSNTTSKDSPFFKPIPGDQ